MKSAQTTAVCYEIPSSTERANGSADGDVPVTPGGELCSVEEVANRIIAHFAGLRRAEVVARFAIGDDVHSVRYSPDFGKRTVQELAQQVGHEVSGLLAMARTAERIRPEERTRLLFLTDAVGHPLLWSHYATLKDIRSAEERMRVACLVLLRRFSVEELKSYLKRQEMISRST